MTNNTKKLRRFMRKAREGALTWTNEQSLDVVIAAEKHAKWDLQMAVRHISILRRIVSRLEPNSGAWRSETLALAKSRKRAAIVAGHLAGYRIANRREESIG